MSHAQIFAALCYALVALGAMIGFWFYVYPQQRAETSTPPKPIQYVGTALQCFMLGAFWPITGPYHIIKALVAKYRK